VGVGGSLVGVFVVFLGLPPNSKCFVCSCLSVFGGSVGLVNVLSLILLSCLCGEVVRFR